MVTTPHRGGLALLAVLSFISLAVADEPRANLDGDFAYVTSDANP